MLVEHILRNELKTQRSDSIEELVKDHILCEYDLIASEAKYHTLYYANFLNPLPSTEKKHCQDNQISEAMAESFDYIKNHDDSQFTLKELRDILTGDPKDECLRIVEVAAAIIHENIRSSVVETKSYSPPSKMLIKKNQEIPKSLLHFLQEVIMKNREGKIADSKTKCTSISHAIMAALRERSFSSQLLSSLSVFLHRRYGSERLIDVLYSLGFATSYACGQYNGQAFFNASRYESDLDEDYTFDPEILQDLETNIFDDENNENELEIFE
ncbi:SWIM-type domain-containing protein [Trichonephila inaurata madagascariensis]|uniref:SWIM-type domain-containing protein n=1 Tax=Trichonephila inaurata madagascariensis TaxID=2747483 RepID=A0A8X6IER2_9ARAC|nr:SWIM-type domain-containing protein [Trichonephila inaurata madagascariensis]